MQTHQDNFGSQISIFGVFDSLDKANNAIKELNKENGYFYEINEIELNKTNELYLGGYIE